MALPVALILGACALDTPPLGPGEAGEPARAYADREQSVVYGDDDRLDVYAHPSERLRELARNAAVALVPSTALDFSDPTAVRIAGGVPTLGEARQLCEDQRFRDQPTAADCSGTLIDNDLVLTAGHCVSNTSCDGEYYVFDYLYEAEGRLAELSRDDVYACSRVVARRLSGGFDYAVVQLDRPVVGREPAPVQRLAAEVPVGSPVTVIGFGSGLPAKIDDGGQVLYSHADLLDYFEATTDTFGGNSGSGVYNAAGDVVGILVRGENDYVSRDRCRVVAQRDENGGGPGDQEEITYAFRAIEDLCNEVGWPSARLCTDDFRDGWCDRCLNSDECPEGWTCLGSGEDAGGTCAPPCDAVGGCLLGHSCRDDGLCHPDVSERCSAGDVWAFDSCGGRLGVTEACAEDERCVSDSCVERPAGDTCSSAQRLDPVSQVVLGDLDRTWEDTQQGSCAGAGPERVYRLDLERPTQLRASARSDALDPVLYLRGACDDGRTELACNDDVDYPNDLGSEISGTVEPGQYFLFVDTYDNRVGEFELTLDLVPFEEERLGETCATPTRVEPVDQRLTGSLAEYTGEYVGSCGGGGAERVFSFTLEEPTRFTAASSGFDTVLYLRRECSDPDTELACHDDVDPGVDQRSIISADLERGDWALFLDTWGDETGEYVLNLRFEVIPCAAECDPGTTRCGPDGDPEVCRPDADGCGSWTRSAVCSAEEYCFGDACVPICEDECGPVGAARCDGARVLTCDEHDGDPCAEWGEASFCPADTRCEAGACVPGDPGEEPGVDFEFPGLEFPDEDDTGGGSLYVAPQDRPPRGEASCGCASSGRSGPAGVPGAWILLGVGLALWRRLGVSSRR